MSFHLSVTVYSPEELSAQNYESLGKSAEHSSSAVTDSTSTTGDDTYNERIPVAARVDATITGPNKTYARQALINTVPKLIKELQAPSDPPPVWAIQERFTAVEMSRWLHAVYSGSDQSNARQNDDLVCAYTITSVEESIGIVQACADTNLPVILSATVETHGKLPDNSHRQLV